MIGSLRRHSPLIDRAILSTPTQRAVRAFRRRAVLANPVRFAAFEFLGRRDRGALHRLRDSSTQVALRHRSRDVDIFDEVWAGRPAYDPPLEVAHLLTDDMTVLDLGANIGLFGVFILHRFPGAVVTAVEPDPSNLRIIRRCMRANGSRWQLLSACASTHSHQVSFEARRYADSRISEEATANSISVPAIDVFPLIEAADFVKMDIEGSEWPILDDSRFQHVTPRVIVLEWHQDGCPHDDACDAALRALRDAGYQTVGQKSGYPHGVIWAWREWECSVKC